jgi:hypothetical protein
MLRWARVPRATLTVKRLAQPDLTSLSSCAFRSMADTIPD